MTDELIVTVLLNQVALILAAIEQSKDERVVQQLMAQFEHTKAVIEELEKRELVTP